MTPAEKALRDAIVELEETAAMARSGRKTPGVLPVLEKVERLAAELPPDTPAELRHFLERKSYAKARAFLERSVPRDL